VLRLLTINGLHAVRVPTVEEDAIRDLVRAPEDLGSAIHNVPRTVVRLPLAPHEPAPGAVATEPELTTTRRGLTDASENARHPQRREE
jgi:hypothetical protein